MKKITKKEWENFVLKNCKDSYSLSVCLATLILWEAQVKDRENAHKILMDEELGLSGAQAGMAISFGLSRKPNKEMLDKEMLKVRATTKNENKT